MQSSTSPPRRPVRDYRGVSAGQRVADRRERLLAAGLEEFGTRGFAATGVKDICRAAGLTDRYFYESFGTSADLFTAVFDHATRQVFDATVAALASETGNVKDQAHAVIEAYVGLKSPELSTAFASSFAEPQIRAHADLLQFFADAGLTLEADEDMTDDFLFTARAAFKQLGERLAAAGALEVPVARELAWEAEAWRMRLQLLATRRLERRRFVLRKPAEAQAENANAPAG